MFLKPFTGQIASADTMTREQKLSFSNHYQTTLLPAGSELWRFVSKQIDNRFGAFWIDGEAMRGIMQTLHANTNFSEAYKKDNIKDSLSILSRWSNLSWRLKIRLRREVIAYVGGTATQKQFQEQENVMPFGGGEIIQMVTETRRGWATQYVIPRFRTLSDQNEWASIELFVHI